MEINEDAKKQNKHLKQNEKPLYVQKHHLENQIGALWETNEKQ